MPEPLVMSDDPTLEPLTVPETVPVTEPSESPVPQETPQPETAPETAPEVTPNPAPSSPDYQSYVGKTMTDGVVVRDFTKNYIFRSTERAKPSPAFLITTEQSLVCRYVPADDFISTHTIKE